jgi:hypothetical protein
MKFLKPPWYFAAFAIYPILALLAYNINQIRFRTGIRSLIISLAVALLLFLVFRKLLGSKQRAALTVSIWLLLFYSYGHIYDLILTRWVNPHLAVWMDGIWLVLFVAATVWLARRRTRVRKAAPVLNVVALGLVITSIVDIILWSHSFSSSVVDSLAPVLAL